MKDCKKRSFLFRRKNSFVCTEQTNAYHRKFIIIDRNIAEAVRQADGAVQADMEESGYDTPNPKEV